MRPFVPHSEAEISDMLAEIGVPDIDALFESVPAACRSGGDLPIAPGLDEYSTAARLTGLASRNRPASAELSFLGGGSYDRIVPAMCAQILSRPEFHSAYTPYQPEVSQGTLQVIFEFQTMVARLYGMEAANASMYDGASAFAEALLMAGVATGRSLLLLPANLNPNCRSVAETYLAGQSYRLQTIPTGANGKIDIAALADLLSGCEDPPAAVAVQSPNAFGVIEDLEKIGPLVAACGSLLIVHADPSSTALVRPPGEFGADIVTGEGQSLGLPMSYGGPGVGLMAVTKKWLRRLPGRLVGRTEDASGRPGFVLTLQTREQHIRREKATSNICTNQGLMALCASVYLAMLGESGLRGLAQGLADRAGYLAGRIEGIAGYRVPFAQDIYQEFVVLAPLPAEQIIERGLAAGIHAGIAMSRVFPELGENALLVCVSERQTQADLDRFATFLEEVAR